MVVYVFACRNNSYYVSNTTDITSEVERSNWLKANPPYEGHMREEGNLFAVTLEYMGHYGVDNVRGSMIPDIELEELDIIKKIVRNANNRCSRCGKGGHYSPKCLEDHDESNKPLTCQLCKGLHSRKVCPLLGRFSLVPKT